MPDTPYTATRNSFHLVRFVLALMVILCHCFTLLKRQTPLSALTGGMLNEGTLAVDGFLTVSGFLICQSALRSRNALTFLGKRVTRLLPTFLVALVLSAVLVGGMAYPGTLAAYLRLPENGPLSWMANWLTLNVTGEQWGVAGVFEGNPTTSLNVSLWTLKFEVTLYLLTAVLMLTRLNRRRGTYIVLWAAFLTLRVLLTAFGLRLWDVQNARFWVLNHWNYDRLTQTTTCFFGGMVLYAYRRELPRRWYMAVFAALALAAVGSSSAVQQMAAASAGVTRLLWQAVKALLQLLYGVALPYLVIYLGSSPMCAGFSRIGDLSLGLYMFSYPIQQLFILCIPSIAPMTLFLGTLAVVLPLAWVNWRCVEAPVQRLKAFRWKMWFSRAMGGPSEETGQR